MTAIDKYYLSIYRYIIYRRNFNNIGYLVGFGDFNGILLVGIFDFPNDSDRNTAHNRII